MSDILCWQFVETGACGHADAEHDAMADMCVIPAESNPYRQAES